MGASTASEVAAPFADTLAAHGDRPAVVTGDVTLTYAQLDDRVRDMADRLGTTRRLVAVEGRNALEPLVAYLAALRGRHPVLLLPPGPAGPARALVDAYDPDVVVDAGSGWTPAVRRAGSRHDLHPDLALLLSTSGSTGSAKLVRLSGENLRSNAAAIAAYLALTPEDRAITSLPMHYCYGLSVINSHLWAGAGIVLTDLSVVDRCFWDLFRVAGATGLAGVPYTFDLLDGVGFPSMSLPSLRYVTQAGGRLDAERVRRYAALGRRDGWDLFVMYGQTEATARMAYLPPHLAATHPHTIGVPIPGGDFTIEPLDGADAGDGPGGGDGGDGDGGDGPGGELVYRGPNVMLGYARDPADLGLGRTVEALRTGDLARRRADGLYEVIGRRSRFIKPYGLRVDLDHLERLLDAAGIANLCTGDDDTLVVAVERGAPTETVPRLVADHVGLPASRVAVVEMDALPRLPNGKPDHPAVRRAARQVTARARESAPVSGAAGAGADVRAMVAAALGRDVRDDDSFVSAGGDSLTYAELAIRLEQVLGPLPRDWHLRPVHELAAAARPRRRLRRVETTVALRAVAIVLVVGTHIRAWYLPGGAHVLIGIAGYNFARFQLAAGTAARSLARIALPSMAWIALVAAASDQFAWPHALLLNGVVGAPEARWGYWFVEALVAILAVLCLLLAVPPVRRLERRYPFGAALAVCAGALAVRFDLSGLFDLASQSHRIARPHAVGWLFALGWAAALATSVPRRLLVSGLILAAVPGFFGMPQREAVVAVGLLLVLWVPGLPVPWPLNRLAGTLAAASLAIYLTHWQVYPPVLRAFGAPTALAAALAAGVAGQAAASAIARMASASWSTGSSPLVRARIVPEPSTKTQ